MWGREGRRGQLINKPYKKKYANTRKQTQRKKKEQLANQKMFFTGFFFLTSVTATKNFDSINSHVCAKTYFWRGEAEPDNIIFFFPSFQQDPKNYKHNLKMCVFK